ncbi:ATP-binding cassette domain-containing protein [Modestobacter sp. VKM Ac-2983]|uniref:ABC transporter ATP-binding protein n=1 Tax=Modestobacter sp. VKM Ac-2983 TaxID=3004137 RepID=UPI0022AB52D1|nr:ATP-binding cassette domain-containing protein [Modestobacter sp. VKM Ac-2983]MCZ2804576.1 ATP-binding cassette domain-containing protein [Modestobacter sp. VKM Ac-2983]
MNCIEVDDVSFRYPATEHLVLDGVSFQVYEGELLGLVGPPGAGKTTLCMAVAGLVPGITGGELSGSVRVEGAVGIVFEDPDGQLTQLRALSEVTDPLRTRGASRDDAVREAHRLLERVGLGGEDLAGRWVWELSEGQQVLLALAATLATQPDVLVLDTVMGSLDATHRAGVLRLLRDGAGARTVVLVEQDATLLGEVADRLVVLEEGRVRAVGTPAELLDDDAVRAAADLGTPGTLAAARRLRLPSRPLTTEAFRVAVCDVGRLPTGGTARPNGHHGDRAAPPWREDRPRIQVRDVDFGYPDRSPALRGLDLEVRPGEVHAVLGHTGAGKSTLVRLLCGLLRPVRGSVVVDDQDTATVHPTDLALRVATVLQDADRTLSQRTVRDEIALSLRRRRRTDGLDDRVDRVRRLVGLPEDVLPADPLLLPRAHRVLVALAAALVVEPAVVVLDSPTTGLSHGGRLRLAAALADLRSRGVAVLITEHDTDVVVEVADTVTVLDRGTVAAQGPVRELLRSTRRAELAARRIGLPTAGVLADAVGVDACTLDDLVAALSAASPPDRAGPPSTEPSPAVAPLTAPAPIGGGA